MNRYKTLFTPIKIGNMSVKNRIFLSPVGTHLATEHYEVTDEILAFYEARAKGGVGLITTECVLIAPNTRYSTFHNMGLFEDRMIEEMKKIPEVMHRYDAKACVQLMHPSSVATPKYNNGLQPIAASPLECRSVGEISRAATIEELKEIVIQFGEAAFRAKKAGFDAIEIHCCHGHGLLGRFISPVENKRVDEYGGNVDGRLKLALDVIAEVKKNVGDQFPIIVRMSCTDAIEGGQSIMEARYIARKFEEAGVSLIHLSNGTMNKPWDLTAPSGIQKAFNAELAEQIKKVVKIPVGFIGRINEPWVADMSIELGKGDVVYVGRAILCDPEFPNKAEAGLENTIRPCIGCNNCIVSINNDLSIRCTMNPEAGNEITEKSMKKNIFNLKNILVIGGGPAGLTASAYAAERGHKVTLIEASNRLGGQMYLAAFPPCKQDIAFGTKYMIERCIKAGVNIVMNCPFDASILNKNEYDAVIVANGGKPAVPEFLKDAKHLVTAWDALEGKEAIGINTVIIGGGLVGCETADFLAHPVNDLNANSRKVTIIEMDSIIAREEKSSFRPLMIRRLLEKGCNIITSAKVLKVFDNKIDYENGGKVYTIENVDTVVCAVGVKSDNVVKENLFSEEISVQIIGDAKKSRNIYSAVAEAYQAVNNLN